MSQDRIFSNTRSDLVDFRFDAEVVGVFPDMIRRSVPAYETVLPLAALILAQSLPARGRVYDLGCSQGASSLALLTQAPDPELEVIGVDASKDMIDSARARVTDPRLALRCADVRDVDFEPCHGVLSNYLLQFLPVEDRSPLLARIYEALEPGGALLLIEKVHLDDPAEDRWANEVHLAFKRANGYSDLEIAQKRSALERVMPIEHEAAHRQRLEDLGYRNVTQWFRCLNWAGFSAWK